MRIFDEHLMQHVANISASPLVEFVSIQIEFHPDGPVRPDGPIICDLQTRETDGNPQLEQQISVSFLINPKQSAITVMEGAITRLKVEFRVHTNACIGLKCVTGVKAMKKVFKEEEVFGAYRADPTTVLTEYTSWVI